MRQRLWKLYWKFAWWWFRRLRHYLFLDAPDWMRDRLWDIQRWPHWAALHFEGYREALRDKPWKGSSE